jgi:hypothetical protein
MRAPLRAALLACAALAAFPVAVRAGDPPAEPKTGKSAGESVPADPASEWKDHMGDIPFLIGTEAGAKEAQFTGKPILYFYTAHG